MSQRRRRGREIWVEGWGGTSAWMLGWDGAELQGGAYLEMLGKGYGSETQQGKSTRWHRHDERSSSARPRSSRSRF
jgi:hypothetical protein